MSKAIQVGALVVAVLIAGIVAAVCVIVWQQPKPLSALIAIYRTGNRRGHGAMTRSAFLRMR